MEDNMSINYDNRKFRPLVNSENGETSADTIFHYRQEGNILTADYAGSQIKKGHLIGLVDDQGRIDMRYHQVNLQGELMTGICTSVPEVQADGSIRLYETWQWTSADHSKGESMLEEVRA